MSLSKPSLKSLEKLIMDVKTNLENSQKKTVKELMEKFDSQELSVKFLTIKLDDVCTDNEMIKKEIFKVKLSNEKIIMN